MALRESYELSMELELLLHGSGVKNGKSKK